MYNHTTTFGSTNICCCSETPSDNTARERAVRRIDMTEHALNTLQLFYTIIRQRLAQQTYTAALKRLSDNTARAGAVRRSYDDIMCSKYTAALLYNHTTTFGSTNIYCCSETPV